MAKGGLKHVAFNYTYTTYFIILFSHVFIPKTGVHFWETSSSMKTAIITGGAGGLGKALSAELLSRDWHVVVLDLPGAALDNCGKNDNVSAYACDLTSETELAVVAQAIVESRPGIDLVIYNAGVTAVNLFAEDTGAAHRKLFEINYFSAVNCARLFLEPLRKTKGVHLAISSVAGFSPLYKRTAYAASKHAMEGFFNSLRSEEKEFGVSVLIAAPSFVATNIGRAEINNDGISRPGSAADALDVMTPKDAAIEIIKGLEKHRPMNPVGRTAKLSWIISRFSPKLFQRLMERQIGNK